MHRRIRLIAAGLALLAVNAAGATWLGETVTVPPVDLIDQDGSSVRLTELMRGRTVVVNFMFTGCSSVCPPQTAILRAARESLADARNVLLISVTVDPLGDGPEQLRGYAKRFDLKPGIGQGWVFLTGKPEHVRRVMQSFGERGSAPDAHAGLVWIGNQASGRWTRLAANNGPAVIAKLVREAAQ
jgi:protein SCO1